MKTLLPERIDLVDMNVAKDNSCVDNNKATVSAVNTGGGRRRLCRLDGCRAAGCARGVGLRAMIGGQGLGYDVAVVEGSPHSGQNLVS